MKTWIVMSVWFAAGLAGMGATETSPLAPLAEAKAAEAKGDAFGVEGLDGWWFSPLELRHLAVGPFWGEAAKTASSATSPDRKDPLPAILNLHEQCKKAGVALILVPIPPKAVIYPEGLDAALPPKRLDPVHREFYGLLRDQGVRVLDLTDNFLAARTEGKDLLYCKTDTHFSPAGARMAAGRIAEDIRKQASFDGMAPRTYEERPGSLEMVGDLKTPEKETLPLWLVKDTTDGTPKNVDSWRESPVLLIGDSHTLVFETGGDMHAASSGLSTHLSRELGFPVDRVGIQGSGTLKPLVTLLRRKDNLAGKKVVVWAFTARDFSASTEGWKPIPVIK